MVVEYSEPFPSRQPKNVISPFERSYTEAQPGINDELAVYLELREEAAGVEKPEGERLCRIQDSVREWIAENGFLDEPLDYEAYDEPTVSDKLISLSQYLQNMHGVDVSVAECAATEAFVHTAFNMYKSTPDTDRIDGADGSFAFVVPPRISRDHPEYGQEVEQVCPALRYVPNELRAAMTVGIPPFVLDVYDYDEEGKRGYLILAPVYQDMVTDMGIRSGMAAARMHVNNTVDFAQRRLGVTFVGLGAVLPSLTYYGKTIKNLNVMTTTGHGGTTYLIKETIKAAQERNAIPNETIRHIGVLGLGSIGASIAELVAQDFPEAEIIIHDKKEKTEQQVRKDLEEAGANVRVANESELIQQSDVVISAIVGKIDLDKDAVGMVKAFFVDDSQPSSLDPEQVNAHGGSLTWVIGHDTLNLVRRQNFDFGSLVDSRQDLFGCEAEVATMARYWAELKARGLEDLREKIIAKLALKDAVNPQGVRYIGALFKKYGIVPSQFQVFGRPTGK